MCTHTHISELTSRINTTFNSIRNEPSRHPQSDHIAFVIKPTHLQTHAYKPDTNDKQTMSSSSSTSPYQGMLMLNGAAPLCASVRRLSKRDVSSSTSIISAPLRSNSIRTVNRNDRNYWRGAPIVRCRTTTHTHTYASIDSCNCRAERINMHEAWDMSEAGVQSRSGWRRRRRCRFPSQIGVVILLRKY